MSSARPLTLQFNDELADFAEHGQAMALTIAVMLWPRLLGARTMVVQPHLGADDLPVEPVDFFLMQSRHGDASYSKASISQPPPSFFFFGMAAMKRKG